VRKTGWAAGSGDGYGSNASGRPKSAGGNDAVDVIVAEQVLAPCVQDGEESDLGSEPLRIGGRLEQGLGTGREQQVEETSRSGECQRVQIVGNCEDEVEVVGVEQVALLCFEPSLRACAPHFGQHRERHEL
jgi:hypothetical protein